MCQSKTEGGKRCEYADKISSLRRKYRRKHAKTSYSKNDLNRQVERDLAAWKEKNREFVTSHMPNRLPFQAKPNKKPITNHTVQLLTPKNVPVTRALPVGESGVHQQLYEERMELEKRLTNEEIWSLSVYSMSFFREINMMLRRKGFSEYLKNLDSDRDKVEAKKIVENHVFNIDSSFAKQQPSNEVRKLYRFFRVPPGMRNVDYAKKYFVPGGGFRDAGFLSTSADIDYILTHIRSKSKHSRNTNYIVFEILTRQGIPMQPEATPYAGSIQTFEAEVLLPRRSKFRIVDVRTNQKFSYIEDREDLNSAEYFRLKVKSCAAGEGTRLPLIQTVDEKLV